MWIIAKFAITIWYSTYEELSKCVQKTNNYNFKQQEVPASFEPMTYRIGSSVLTTELELKSFFTGGRKAFGQKLITKLCIGSFNAVDVIDFIMDDTPKLFRCKNERKNSDAQ